MTCSSLGGGVLPHRSHRPHPPLNPHSDAGGVKQHSFPLSLELTGLAVMGTIAVSAGWRPVGGRLEVGSRPEASLFNGLLSSPSSTVKLFIQTKLLLIQLCCGEVAWRCRGGFGCVHRACRPGTTEFICDLSFDPAALSACRRRGRAENAPVFPFSLCYLTCRPTSPSPVKVTPRPRDSS